MSEVQVENQELVTEEAVKEEKPKAKKTKGIFRIFNRSTGFEHYGVSSQVEVCFRDYHQQLNNGKHSNKKLQEEFDASEGAIEMEVVKEFPAETTLKELHAAKREYLAELKTASDSE